MLMIQVECIWKVQDVIYDLVVIDECLSVFNQINSPMMDKHRTISAFQSIMYNSSYVVVLDAFLN